MFTSYSLEKDLHLYLQHLLLKLQLFQPQQSHHELFQGLIEDNQEVKCLYFLFLIELLPNLHLCTQVHVYTYIFFHSIINLKLASAYPNRIAESFLSFASEINRISLSEFLRSVSSEDDRLLKNIRRQTVPSDKFYNYICEKVRVIHLLYCTINYHTSLVAHIQWCGNSEPIA